MIEFEGKMQGLSTKREATLVGLLKKEVAPLQEHSQAQCHLVTKIAESAHTVEMLSHQLNNTLSELNSLSRVGGDER